MMPDMDGYEVATQLRKHPATEGVPILMFTAKTAVNDKIAGFQSGADDYLTKPIHPAELITRVEALLQRQARINPEMERGRIISFLPTKGGIGTSTLAVNTALEIKHMYAERQVALVELREGNGTISMQLGITASGGLQALMEKPLPAITKELVTDNIVRHNSGVYLLLSVVSPRGIGPRLSRDRVRTILRYLNADFDYVLLDLSSALDEATSEALRMTSEIVMTLEPNQIGMAMAQEMLTCLDKRNIGAHKARIVLINRVPAVSSLNRNTVEQALEREMICGIPPVPDLAYESAQTGKPMVNLQPRGLISQQIRLVVQSITKAL
jgi:pilus assembly protein CpaE